jgi:hypothetical protein
MRNQITALLLVCAALLSGCGDGPAKDPTPGADARQHIENARLSSMQVGQPFELNGCQVTLNELFISYPGTWQDKWVTMATANCPTAKATATNENCGKNCTHNTVRLEPAADSAAQAGAPAQALGQAQADAQAQARELQRATQIAQLKEKLAQLHKEMDGVSEDLKRMQ